MDSIGIFDLLLYIIIWFSLGELSLQVVISELADWLRGAMLLNQPYNKTLSSISNPVFWRKILGNWWFITTPLILLISIHKFFSNLLACPYCVCTHLCWLTNWLYLDMDLFTSFLLAPLGLVFVALLDKIHTR